MKRVRKLLCLALALVMALSLAPTALGDPPREGCLYGGNHSWVLQYDTSTCTESGVRRYQCRECKHVYTENVPARGHQWGDWFTEEAGENGEALPSCTQGVWMYRHCLACEEPEDRYFPALGHAWNEGEIQEDAGFPGGKKLHFWCWRCGATKDEAIPQEETEDDYDWEPPEEPEEPEIPDEAVSPAMGGPSEDYSISAVPEDTSDRELGYCDETPVSIAVTNTGNEPVRIRFSMHKGHGADFSTKDYYDLAFVSWDAAYTESLSWNYGTWEAVLQPEESSTLVVKVCMMSEDLDHDAVERQVWFHCSPVGEEDSELAWNQAANISVPPMGPEVLLWVVLKYLPDPALSVGETATFALQLFTSGGRYVIHKEIDMYE